jgi:ABC-type cobalt transport system substrate-binding protein
VPAAELHGPASAVIWSQAVDAAQAGEFAGARLGLSLSCVAEAGCGSLEADRDALERLRTTRGPVVVFTPAWEPPLLEFSDFLGALRASIGAGRSIVVVPVGESLHEAAPRDSDNWRLAVGRLGDPHAYVETGSQ